MTVKRMEFLEDLGTSSDYLRMAVPLMIQRKIPPTPYNYALWYAHVQNVSPELSKALLEHFPRAGSYDHDKSESLFFEFFVKNYLPNNQKAQNLLVNIVSQLARAVSKNVKGTHVYSSALKDAMDLFDVAVDPQRIRDTLSQLLADTATVETLSLEFQLELQSARSGSGKSETGAGGKSVQRAIRCSDQDRQSPRFQRGIHSGARNGG